MCVVKTCRMNWFYHLRPVINKMVVMSSDIKLTCKIIRPLTCITVCHCEHVMCVAFGLQMTCRVARMLDASNCCTSAVQYRAYRHAALISGFRRGPDEVCTLLGYYAASRNIPAECRSYVEFCLCEHSTLYTTCFNVFCKLHMTVNWVAPSMNLSHPCKASSSLACQWIPHIVWELNVHSCLYKHFRLAPVLSDMNLVGTLTLYLTCILVLSSHW
jgi:hypothetical protein